MMRVWILFNLSEAAFIVVNFFPEGDEGEKGFVDRTKEFVAGFDEEKEKLLDIGGI